MRPITYLKISVVLLKMSLTQLSSWIESAFVNRNIKSIHDAGKTLKGKLVGGVKNQFIIIRFIRLCLRILTWIGETIYFIYRYNKYLIKNFRHLFYNRLIPDKIDEIALFGISDGAKIVFILAKQTGIKIAGIYDNVEGLKFSGHKVSHYMNLKDYQGKILVSSAVNIEEKAEKLRSLGIKKENILRWQKFL